MDTGIDTDRDMDTDTDRDTVNEVVTISPMSHKNPQTTLCRFLAEIDTPLNFFAYRWAKINNTFL
jgi:hypothetical protein